MHILITVLVCFFAGMGAGLGTGFAGMSAAAVISPMLITFLHMDPYMAVGIALAGIWYNAQLPPLAYPGAPAQDAEILFTTWADRYPAEGQTALTLRTTLQWLAVTVF